MVSVSDIVKLLDQVPLWKALRALPDRVSALEGEVARLREELAATKAAPDIVPGDACPSCGHKAMRLTESEPHPRKRRERATLDIWTCGNCGHAEQRESIP